MFEQNANKRSAVYAEEALVVDVQSFLHRLMKEKGMSRTELAEAMGVTKARVSQIFSDDCKNFTIKLLARAVYAMGEVAEVTCTSCKRLDEEEASAERAALIAAAQNVTSIWENLNAEEEVREEEEGLFECPGDERLGLALGALRRPRLPEMAVAQ
ncbi:MULTISPECIES: helix-turn-helix domain-containing protein [Sphingomonas]|uniref:helix-turn-helix domain-containing protein n=1 Tax=Sphingomonas TaxID=13687 RepID=UPI0013B3EE86|nr:MULTISPECIES: helix-turn-helix transcriptional regulator [Sphingomonas]